MKLRRYIPALVLGVLLLAACSQKALFPEPTATPVGPSPILSPLEPGATAPTGPDTGAEFDALLTRLAAAARQCNRAASPQARSLTEPGTSCT